LVHASTKTVALSADPESAITGVGATTMERVGVTVGGIIGSPGSGAGGVGAGGVGAGGVGAGGVGATTGGFGLRVNPPLAAPANAVCCPTVPIRIRRERKIRGTRTPFLLSLSKDIGQK